MIYINIQLICKYSIIIHQLSINWCAAFSHNFAQKIDMIGIITTKIIKQVTWLYFFLNINGCTLLLFIVQGSTLYQETNKN